MFVLQAMHSLSFAATHIGTMAALDGARALEGAGAGAGDLRLAGGPDDGGLNDRQRHDLHGGGGWGLRRDGAPWAPSASC